MKEKVVLFLKIILLIASIALVIIGQKTVGKQYLLMQLIGIAGILFIVWSYNRKFT